MEECAGSTSKTWKRRKITTTALSSDDHHGGQPTIGTTSTSIAPTIIRMDDGAAESHPTSSLVGGLQHDGSGANKSVEIIIDDCDDGDGVGEEHKGDHQTSSACIIHDDLSESMEMVHHHPPQGKEVRVNQRFGM